MDDFLAGLYAEEQEKIAAADLGGFMDTLPVNELEDFLGLAKLAVGGAEEPDLPASEGGKLRKEQKKTDAEVAKLQGQLPSTRGEEKKAQGFGDEGMGGDGGMETTAAAKAKIAMRAMRVTRGAPPHIKLAAARFAGNEMAKTAGIGSNIRGMAQKTYSGR